MSNYNWAGNFLKNIEVGPVKFTGGTVLVVLGLVVVFGLNSLLGWIGASPANPTVQWAVGVVLIIVGIVYLFWEKFFPKKG